MSVTLAIRVGSLWLAVCLALTPLAAQNKSGNKNNKDEQRENQRVRDAQKALDEAQDRHKDAARELTTASKRLTTTEAETRTGRPIPKKINDELFDELLVRA